MKVIKAIDGRPIVNAKKPLILHVTENDIKKADIKEPVNCAAARACKRDLHALEARIHLGRIYLRFNESNWVRYNTPKAMRSEIIAFDRGGTFEPGEYRLEVPSKRTPPEKIGSRTTRGMHKVRTFIHHIVHNVRTGPA